MHPLEILARGGYAARGVVYAVVGAFAIRAAFVGGEAKGTEDAAPLLLSQPFGKVLVALLALGLLGYAVWRAVQAITDTDGHGGGAKGWTVRAAMLASAAVYAGLALSAAALLLGSGGESGGGGRAFMDRAVSLLGATSAAGAFAAIFLGAAVGQAVRAFRGTFLRYFRVGGDKRRIIEAIGRAGLLARAAVFLILAWMMGYRAWTGSQAGAEPPKLEDVLVAVRDMPAGDWLLGALGVGLVAFAAYSLTAALYRTIDFRPFANAARRGADAIADLPATTRPALARPQA